MKYLKRKFKQGVRELALEGMRHISETMGDFKPDERTGATLAYLQGLSACFTLLCFAVCMTAYVWAERN